MVDIKAIALESAIEAAARQHRISGTEMFGILRVSMEYVGGNPDSMDDAFDILGDLANARIAVIRDYQPDSPGWTGDLFIVVWGGGYETLSLIFRNNEGRWKLEAPFVGRSASWHVLRTREEG